MRDRLPLYQQFRPRPRSLFARGPTARAAPLLATALICKNASGKIGKYRWCRDSICAVVLTERLSIGALNAIWGGEKALLLSRLASFQHFRHSVVHHQEFAFECLSRHRPAEEIALSLFASHAHQ